jgi:hypothetical protein
MSDREPGPVPVACELDAAGLAERVEEWRALLGASVVSVSTGPTAVRLVLVDTERALVAAASLAQREKQCCPFFDVHIEIEADRRTLVLSVPDGAEEALASFLAAVRE